MFSQNKALVERGHAEVKELQLPLKKNMGVILSTLNTGLRRIAWARVVPTFPLTASPAQPPPLIPRPSAQAPDKRERQQTEKALFGGQQSHWGPKVHNAVALVFWNLYMFYDFLAPKLKDFLIKRHLSNCMLRSSKQGKKCGIKLTDIKMKDSQNVFRWLLLCGRKKRDCCSIVRCVVQTLNQLWYNVWICFSLSRSGTDLVNESKKLLLVQRIQEIWARNMKMAVSDTDLKHEHTKETLSSCLKFYLQPFTSSSMLLMMLVIIMWIIWIISLGACLTSSFAHFGRLGRVTHVTG